jgi:hypothetical protein
LKVMAPEADRREGQIDYRGAAEDEDEEGVSDHAAISPEPAQSGFLAS